MTLEDHRLAVGVAAVDVVIVVALVVIGRVHHGQPILTDPLGVAVGAVPFVVGWLLAGLLAGVFAETTIRAVGPTARLTTVAWVAAANVGLVVRSADVVPGGTTWPFGLVITGFGLLAVVGWRVGLSMILQRVE